MGNQALELSGCPGRVQGKGKDKRAEATGILFQGHATKGHEAWPVCHFGLVGTEGMPRTAPVLRFPPNWWFGLVVCFLDFKALRVHGFPHPPSTGPDSTLVCKGLHG